MHFSFEEREGLKHLKKAKFIFFDLNGVLAELLPEGLLGIALNVFLKSPLLIDSHFNFSGTDWIDELREYGINVDDEKTLELISEWMFEYSRREGLIGLYDWVEEEIPRIARKWPLYILTNNSCKSAKLALNGMEKHFQGIYGWQNVPALKPSPDGILSICWELGIDPGEVLMVGDGKEDRIAAASAGAMSYIVRYSGMCPAIFL